MFVERMLNESTGTAIIVRSTLRAFLNIEEHRTNLCIPSFIKLMRGTARCQTQAIEHLPIRYANT
eukprot:5185139-Amphidinium_carterae.1